MGEPEQKKSGGSGWIIALVAVFLVGGMCVVGMVLAILGGGALVFLGVRNSDSAPMMQERMTDMAPDAMPSIPEMPKLPEIPNFGNPEASKPPGE